MLTKATVLLIAVLAVLVMIWMTVEVLIKS